MRKPYKVLHISMQKEKGNDMAKVTVCHFRKWDIDANQYVLFPDNRMATPEKIKGFGEGFSPIPETCIEVDESEVDSNGRYTESAP